VKVPDEPEQLGGSLKLTFIVPIALFIGGVVVPLQVTIKTTALTSETIRMAV
jgi:hypothetical protein